uniref:Ras association domain-containing protein 7 n=1 Tax=Saimiri boliviensis boliviensis TaxID=39432 RepID=A0A2K6TQ79_SAIBB|nr:ras association domain-containing protein 7 isoform X2 [Saimiri boliviensis boliviensis]XP_039327019.1 ras association domain-containing protein 7 isoform X2 [Saimiri boliviensis boliviensis]
MLLGLAAMELKVWVDGIQRVVCGVSEQTTCQEVVIALAQAIGQTGRFVLVQRLREKERQLLPEECPVGAQATCGQFASDVQFVLRRTGPSLAGRPSSDSCPPPERCPIRASLPAKPRAALGCEPCKALTLGPAPSLSSTGPAAPMTPLPGCCTDLRSLELRVQRNAEELGHEAFWEQELRREQAREREGQARLQALSAATAEHAARLQALDAQARALEAELQLAAEAPGPPSPMASATERLRQDLAVQERQSAEVQGSLALVSRALEAAERALQAQAQELEELNRELRQCNLQQFIQQTGAALPPPPRPDRGSPNTQGPLSPAREESPLGPPLSPMLVPTLGPQGMSVSHLPLGPGALLWLQPPQPVSSHSGFHEAELLEVAAAPAPERHPLAAQPQALGQTSEGGETSLPGPQKEAGGHRGLLHHTVRSSGLGIRSRGCRGGLLKSLPGLPDTLQKHGA